MTRIIFRRAVAADAAACSAILLEWVADTPWYPVATPDSASADSMRERIETGHVDLALCRGRIAGFMAVQPGLLDCLYIARDFRGRGIGKVLLDRCKAQLKAGFSLWTLAQNHGAGRFYRREGLVETAHSNGDRNEENLPDIEFSWQGARRFP